MVANDLCARVACLHSACILLLSTVPVWDLRVASKRSVRTQAFKHPLGLGPLQLNPPFGIRLFIAAARAAAHANHVPKTSLGSCQRGQTLLSRYRSLHGPVNASTMLVVSGGIFCQGFAGHIFMLRRMRIQAGHPEHCDVDEGFNRLKKISQLHPIRPDHILQHHSTTVVKDRISKHQLNIAAFIYCSRHFSHLLMQLSKSHPCLASSTTLYTFQLPQNYRKPSKPIIPKTCYQEKTNFNFPQAPSISQGRFRSSDLWPCSPRSWRLQVFAVSSSVAPLPPVLVPGRASGLTSEGDPKSTWRASNNSPELKSVKNISRFGSPGGHLMLNGSKVGGSDHLPLLAFPAMAACRIFCWGDE